MFNVNHHVYIVSLLVIKDILQHNPRIHHKMLINRNTTRFYNSLLIKTIPY